MSVEGPVANLIAIQKRIAELERKLISDKHIRNANLTVRRPDESYFRHLDSSLKKTTGFVKKLRTISWIQVDSIIQDFSKLNLTKYVGEIASALVEAKFKLSDIPNVIKFSNAVFNIYIEFSNELMDCWKRTWTPLLEQSDIAFDLGKLRVDLKFYAELIIVGIIKVDIGLPLLEKLLNYLIDKDQNEHKCINVILSFCHYCGNNFGSLVPKELQDEATTLKVNVPKNTLLSEAKHLTFRTLYKTYYVSICKRMLRIHRELCTHQKQNKHIISIRGELSKERQAKSHKLKTLVQNLQNSIADFAEVLNEEVPLVDDEIYQDEEDKTSNEDLFSNVWEDDDTKQFYESLPDIKQWVSSSSTFTSNNTIPISEEALAADCEDESDDGLDTKIDEEEDALPPEPDVIEEPDKFARKSNRNLMDVYLNKLQQSESRDMIDQCAIDFVTKLNTKYNRKRLVKALFDVPVRRLDLLPFYARFTAILFPVAPDIAQELNHYLKKYFKFQVRKREQINLMTKLKTTRFIGELVKFNMYSKIEALFCLKILLNHFSYQHHVEMCCQFIEVCGRYLFRHKTSHHRMKFYLEVMMRKKSVMPLEYRYVTMIENAYYEIYPPDRASSTNSTKKELSLDQQTVRSLLYDNLNKINIEEVSKKLLKLNWKDEELVKYIVRCLVRGFRVTYYRVRYLASVVAALSECRETVATRVIEGVLRNIQYGLENNITCYNQQRVAMMRYLCELYAYRLTTSKTMFDVLYTLITFGVSFVRDQPSSLDPPDNVFRIRLCCIVLDTLGKYLESKHGNKKLDLFLVFFQHYFWYKFTSTCWTDENPFPFYIHHYYEETLNEVRPAIKLFESFEESSLEIHELKARYVSIVKDQSEKRNGSFDENTVELDLKVIIEVIAAYDAEKEKHTAKSNEKQLTEKSLLEKQEKEQNVSKFVILKREEAVKQSSYSSVLASSLKNNKEKAVRKRTLLGIGRGKPISEKYNTVNK